MNKPMNIRLAIADDHQIVIDGLCAALKNFPFITVNATHTNGKLLLDNLKSIPVDVLLTDVMMPEFSGLELAVALRQEFPDVKIIALSMSGTGLLVEEMINKAGIEGYLLKHCGIDELTDAIQKVFAGGHYFQPTVLDELSKHIQLRIDTVAVRLTTREKEIIALMEKDCSNKQIADVLYISVRTVETHRKNIFRKTGTNNLLGLVKWAYEHKIL
ncbi:response regulator transcription factor [Pedobacter sp. Leaf250]|uniref:response regulator n=1 Tax=Pedobacter sp. Leaf250 TaxID=2876559 RepID=UPI0010E8EC5D|nr:response regulator transcription factor [Pedobacter sp. Leaf250]RYD80530.1 MAG: response regulator transcription factor [Sphingobacteriales bacterium]